MAITAAQPIGARKSWATQSESRVRTTANNAREAVRARASMGRAFFFGLPARSFMYAPVLTPLAKRNFHRVIGYPKPFNQAFPALTHPLPSLSHQG